MTGHAKAFVLREVMDIRQASAYLGIASDTLYRYAAEGFIPSFKLGNRWRFKRSILDAWIVKTSKETTKARRDQAEIDQKKVTLAGDTPTVDSRPGLMPEA